MSRNSLHDFFDGPLDGEDDGNVEVTPEETPDIKKDAKRRDATDQLGRDTDSEQSGIVTQCAYSYETSDSSLLRDYVVVEMADAGYTSREKPGFLPRVKTPYTRRGTGKAHRAKSNSQVIRRNEDVKGDESARSSPESGGYKTHVTSCECGEDESFTHRIRMEHIYIPQVDSSHSTISCFGEARNSSDGKAADNDEQEEDSDIETEEDDDDDDDEGDDELEEDVDDEEYSTDYEDYEGTNNQPYEGRLSVVSIPSNSCITTLNCNLYKTDGEDQVLSDITISRSYAHLHRQEIVDAGAKTIGELYISLKRKKAQERTEDAEENGDNRDTSSTLLIPKRKDENEKLKNKGKQKIPKSTIPFEEKQVSKTRQKSAADDGRAVIISKKSYTGKPRSSPRPSVAFTSEIHVGPEVRGDMGNATTSTATAPSAESLTPEILTRLCSTETGYRSSGRNRSIGSQLFADEDSRAGYVSGRKNPQAKPVAIIRESGKSRIPLPVNRKGSVRTEQHTVSVSSTDDIAGNQAAGPSTGNNWTTNSVTANKKTLPETQGHRFKTHRLQLQNPAQLLAKGPSCTVEKKPPIPHQMRSAACYHNGKLDVSILGDRHLIANTNPLDVQITLLPQVMADNPTIRQHALPPLKNPPPPPPCNAGFNRVQNQQTDGSNTESKIRAMALRSSKKDKCKRKISSKKLPPLKRVGRKLMVKGGREVSRPNFWAPGKSRMEQKVGRDKVTRKGRPLSPIDRDVVHHRAQLPPFNTYTDHEASVRFQKIWCGI